MTVAMFVYGALVGTLLGQGVDWWLAWVAPFGWTLPLIYVTANLLAKPKA